DAEAVTQFETALEKRADAVEPLLALARAHMTLGQADRAEARVRQLLDNEPVNAAGLNLLGEIQLASGRFDEAREQFRQLIALYPTVPGAYARLADLQLRAGDRDGAVATLRTGLDSTERNPFLLFRLGMLLQETGQEDEAISVYEEVLKTNPQAEAVINNLAMLLVNHRRDDPEALARARELTQDFAGSDQWVLLDTLGWVQFRSGDADAALATIERASAMVDPMPAEMLYHLGLIKAGLGRTDEARQALARALESGETFPGIEEARETFERL
ncbi:MAG: tetratricopeptide repeat protein, partial [Sphingobacteriia bacterium]|nr:tetratricopeptide repeat protein [Sphingobacteriia bacterium]